MAYVDPWTPQPGGIPQQQGALDQFGNFMDDPRARAALLSFGISMMQPRAFADTPMSQLGRALGTAGESVDRVVGQDRKDVELGIKAQEADSKQDLRTAQAGAAESRAYAAETRANAANERTGFQAQQLDLRRQMLQQIQERHGINARLRVQQAYAKEVERINEENNSPLRPRAQPPTPIPSFDQWAGSKPEVRGLLDALPPISDPTAAPTPTPSPTTATPAPAPSNPALPRDPKQRTVGQVYTAPNGQNVQWDGKGLLPVP